MRGFRWTTSHTATALSSLLIVAALSVSYLMIEVSTDRALTQPEGILFQIVIMAAGLAGSFVIGRQAARVATRTHARSAFRRVLRLYGGLGRLAQVIGEAEQDPSKPQPETLAILRAIVVELTYTADEAIEDWRDLVPRDVEELETRRLAANEEQVR